MVSSSDCDVAFTIQMANQPLFSLFTSMYGGTNGRQAWMNLPSNQALVAAGNQQEVTARWNLLVLGASQATTAPNCNALVCSTWLRSSLALHDLLLLSVLPQTYQAESCAIPAMAVPSSTQATITTINGMSGTTSTNAVQSRNTPAPIVQQLIPSNMGTVNYAASPLGKSGFAGTASNQTLFGGGRWW